MLLSLSGAPRSLDLGRLSPLAFSSFPAIFLRKACPNPRCHWIRPPFLLLSLVRKDDRLCGCGGLVSSRMALRSLGTMPRRGAPLPGIPGCSRTSCGRSAACPDDDRAAEWWTSRHRLWGPGPACRVGIRRRAVPGKGVFRPCPPAPLLVAGGALTFLNIIPTLLSVFDFRTGSAIRGKSC